VEVIRSERPPFQRFPRARGDAPLGINIEEGSSKVPPRTRGCPRPAEHAQMHVQGSPAHAGMHRLRHRDLRYAPGSPAHVGMHPSRWACI
jgi:hypothetical protein